MAAEAVVKRHGLGKAATIERNVGRIQQYVRTGFRETAKTLRLSRRLTAAALVEDRDGRLTQAQQQRCRNNGGPCSHTLGRTIWLDCVSRVPEGAAHLPRELRCQRRSSDSHQRRSHGRHRLEPRRSPTRPPDSPHQTLYSTNVADVQRTFHASPAEERWHRLRMDGCAVTDYRTAH